VCSSKEKFLATLDCEQKVKKEVATLLDVGTEKLKKAQAVL
jgi:ferritin